MDKQEIYDFMNGRDVSTSFSDKSHNSEISFDEFLEVDVEAKRVKSKINSLMSGRFVLEEKVTAVYEGEELISEEVPAVYYKVGTKTDLLAQLTSDLNVEDLLSGLMNGSTWTDYVNSFKSVEE